ncbi:MAG: phosphoribosyltransferase [Eubacteriales bacterium]
MFQNRQDAGEKLSSVLEKYKGEDVIVMGIPRGGVVVAAEVAKRLGAPLDVIIPRKIGAPHNPEVAIGAVTQDGTVIKDEAMVQILGISDDQLNVLAGRVSGEIARRVNAYRGGRPGIDIHNKTVIIVDDGIATGFTIKAAIKSVRSANPRRLVLAVPVAPADTVQALRETVDELVCLQKPELFYAVGQFYTDFDQTSDAEVIQLLAD